MSSPRTADTPVAPPRFDCVIAGPQAPAPPGAPLPLAFTLINRSGRELWVLTWQTPLEPWRGPVFEVTRDGAEVAYLGPMVKRGDPVPESYQRVASGGALRAALDLNEAYDVAAPGRYQVAGPRVLLDVRGDVAEVPSRRDAFRAVEISCDAVTVVRAGR